MISEFRRDFEDFLKPYVIFESSPHSQLNEEGYEVAAETDLFRVLGFIEVRRGSLIELGDRMTVETHRMLFCDVYSMNGQEVELKKSYKIREEDTGNLYQIMDIDKPLGHHFEIRLQSVVGV